MDTIRIRTSPNTDESYINLNITQKFDFIEILSLKLSQEDAYRRFCSDYGVIVGRVTVNNGFGVPNAKVSIFIPIDDIDIEDSELFGLYPYERVIDVNSEGIRYNLLPKTNETQNDCFTPIGSFFNKREILDNPIASKIYNKYYKFTTTTNDSGDFMLFGVPVGTHQLHVDADLSNIGILSQFPYDFIREGANSNLFESSTKFKSSKNLTTLSQLKTRSPISVNVQPFWGDIEQCNIGITRSDVDLATNIVPTAIFMGSIFGDNVKNSINKRCRPKKDLGKLSEMTTGNGTIEMIRKGVNGNIEFFDINNGELIDDDGAWVYQIPMNLDYKITDEFGNLIDSNNPNIGIPTRASVRFRVGLNSTGNEAKIRTRAKYLIPNNPTTQNQVDYSFGENTKDSSFYDLYWNKIYTVSNHITRIQRTCAKVDKRCIKNKNYIGLKDVEEGSYTPLPFNKITTTSNPLFGIICVINKIILTIVGAFNAIMSALCFIPLIGRPACKALIPLECDGISYCVGCFPRAITRNGNGYTRDKVKDGKYQACTTITLIDSLNLIKFNFYNDWLNGSLYSFLLTYRFKRRGRGREKFCDYGCDDPNIGSTNRDPNQADNKCYKKFIVDSGVAAEPQNLNTGPNNDVALSASDYKIDEGLIVKDKDSGELYYAATTKDLKYKLYSTNIITLGAITEYDWQGTPKIYQYFPETTFNLPEPVNQFDEDPPQTVEVSGWSPLFISASCTNINTNSSQVNNVKRICELGMGLDEDRTDDGGRPANARIGNEDIENDWVRAAFTFLNSDNIVTNFNGSVLIDRLTFPKYDHPQYEKFRGYDIVKITNPNIWQFKNSYYFYFGIIPGKNSLQKMLLNYMSPCKRIFDNEVKILVDNVIDDGVNNVFGNGSITFSVIGGIEPYTYSWFGPTYNNQQYTCSGQQCGNPDGSQFTLDNLLPGQYTLFVTDSSGLSTNVTLTVGGLPNINCDIRPVPIVSNNQGELIINVNGGVPPYIATISSLTDTSFTLVETFNGVNGANTTISNIPQGDYIVTIVDSGINQIINGETINITTQCSKIFSIVEQDDIIINGEIVEPRCNGEFADVVIDINGGVPPYTFEWEKIISPTNQIVVSNLKEPQNLTAGNYLLTVTDLGGNTNTEQFLISEPTPITINNTIALKPGCSDSESAYLKFNIQGGEPPYNVIVGQYEDNVTNELVISEIFPDNYNVTIIDTNGCELNIDQVSVPNVDEFIVTALVENNNTVVLRFGGGHGFPYHVKFNTNNWIKLDTTNQSPNPLVTVSPIQEPNRPTIYEVRIPINQILTNINSVPFDFDYTITDGNQQNNYGYTRCRLSVDSNSDYRQDTYDSENGFTEPYGCYSYRNLNNTLPIGNSPQGTLITLPE